MRLFGNANLQDTGEDGLRHVAKPCNAMQVQGRLYGIKWTGTCLNMIDGKEAVRQI